MAAGAAIVARSWHICFSATWIGYTRRPATWSENASDLAERVTRPAERVGMLLREELRAVVAARLLVREHGEDEAAGTAPGSPPSPAGTP